MKKKNIKNFNLNKKVVSDLDKLQKVGGAQYSTDCWTDIFTSIIIRCEEPEPLPATKFPGDVCPI